MAGALSGARHRGVGGEEPGAASQSTRHPRRSKRSHRPSAATLEGGSARKLLEKLEQTQPEGDWPAASTVADLLRREGLSQAPKKRPRTPPQRRPFTQITQPNQTWCADFKGWFLTGDRARCDPLTLTDAHRRYRLRCQIVPNTDTVPTAAARKQQDGFTPFSRSTITSAPHQGLDHLTPAACYTGSPRSMPRRVPELE